MGSIPTGGTYQVRRPTGDLGKRKSHCQVYVPAAGRNVRPDRFQNQPFSFRRSSLIGGIGVGGEFLESKGYAVKYAKIKSGEFGYLTREKKIVLKEDESMAQNLDTLCHEMGHAFLGHLDDKELSRSEKELEAETVAWIVCRNLGLETRETSFGYLATWVQEEDRDQKLERAAHRACEAAKKILEGLEEIAILHGGTEQEKEVKMT